MKADHAKQEGRHPSSSFKKPHNRPMTASYMRYHYGVVIEKMYNTSTM